MAKLTDDADYDAGKTSKNVPSPRFDTGNCDNYYGRRLRTRCVLLILPDNKTKAPTRVSLKTTLVGLAEGSTREMYPDWHGRRTLKQEGASRACLKIRLSERRDFDSTPLQTTVPNGLNKVPLILKPNFTVVKAVRLLSRRASAQSDMHR
ncbi:unnamed protein product [Protopolystoma xenopodis]|uniref:Uncharacterized protein n=1 Tax=Protopolystoma xenopodis TaxID=117903 RepID=A0A448XFS5_9PLAT|nr:unnamed protein product [Protopolystoma xenopodis]